MLVEPVETSRRVVTVRRPFDSRDETFPSDGRPSNGFLAVGRRLLAIQGDKVLDLGERPPQVPPGDVRLSREIGDLERLKLAQRRGSSRVAGRACTVDRLGGPLGDPIRRPTRDEYADFCIDAEGLVLSERWYYHGKLLRETRAVRVEVAVPGDAAFEVDDRSRSSAPTGVGQVERLPIDELPDIGADYWTAPHPPWGFRLVSRWRAMTITAVEGTPSVQDLAYVDTYVRGGDTIGVEHREVAPGTPPAQGAERVTAGDLGEGALVPTFFGPEIDFVRNGWEISVRGSVGPRHLREFAERLRPSRRSADDGR